VLYYLRPRVEPVGEFRRPAYVHKRDPLDARLNKGIGDRRFGGLTIGVDLAVARDAEPHEAMPEAPDPTSDPPRTPTVDTQGLVEAGTLYLRAVKAQTRLVAQLEAHAPIPATAQVAAESTEIDAGQNARIVVTASDANDRYELRRNGKPERRARFGNGAQLVFNTDTVDVDTLFVMHVTRRRPQGLKLAREIPIRIRVRQET